MTKQEFERQQQLNPRRVRNSLRGTKALKLKPADQEEYDLYISEVAEEVRVEHLEMYDNSVDEIVTAIAWTILDSYIESDVRKVIEYLDSKGYKTNEQKVYKLAGDILAQV